MLDSSSIKVQKHLENSLIVPPFEAKDLLIDLDKIETDMLEENELKRAFPYAENDLIFSVP